MMPLAPMSQDMRLARHPWGAVGKWIGKLREVTLHIGAHRTGCTTFQNYLSRHGPLFRQAGIRVYGPRANFRGTRPVWNLLRLSEAGLPQPIRSVRDVQDKNSHIIISDQSLIGGVRDNMRRGILYDNVGRRMVRFAKGYSGRLNRLILCCRSLETYWTSVLASGVERGLDLPSADHLDGIAHHPRGWRRVIEEVSAALPDIEIVVIRFETVAGRPEEILRRGAAIGAPQDYNRKWLLKRPGLPVLRRILARRGPSTTMLPLGMDKWNPFTPGQTSALRELYETDMAWLAAGAQGRARLIEDCGAKRAGCNLTTPLA